MSSRGDGGGAAGVAALRAVDFEVSATSVADPNATIVIAPGGALAADVVAQFTRDVRATACVRSAVLAIVVVVVAI